MYPYLFGISTYTLLVALGVAAMFGIFAVGAIKKLKTSSHELSDVMLLLFAALAVGYVGAALFDSIFKIPEQGFKLAGITFYGALICGLICFVAAYKLFYKKMKLNIPLKDYLNLLAFCIPLGHAIGRIGCFFGGCCHGYSTDSIFGIYFPEGSPPYLEYGAGVKVLPVQLFEAVALLILFLFFVFCKNEKVKNNRIYIYLLYYAVVRFLLEFLRGDLRGGLFVFVSPAQFLSICIAVFVPLCIVLSKRRAKLKVG